MNDKTQKHVLMGVIGAPHGVRGQVRIKSYTGDPLAIGAYGPLSTRDGRQLEIAGSRFAKGVVIATLKGVTTREGAEALRNVELFIDRAQLPGEALADEEFYVDDLVGLTAVDEAGAVTGTVIAVHNYGAGDMIELRSPGGNSAFYPFTRQVVPRIDFDAGQLTLVPPDEIVVQPGAEDE